MRHPSCLLTILLTLPALMSEGQSWTGYFSGDEPTGIHSTANLKRSNSIVRGVITMNGKAAQLNATAQDGTAKGTLHDIETGSNYSLTATLKGNDLSLAITFPELQGQVIELRMKKGMPAASAAPGTARDKRLLGTWRHTEVINSGSGSNFGSFSSEQFMEFLPNGTVRSWTGASAGGSGDVSFQGGGNGNVQQGEWYTEGNLVFFVDPSTRQKLSTRYAVDGTRMMFTNGNRNTIFEKIR